ncbi:hypothetical protein F4677DRAFT_419081 [Hypoxylon crocopeplum]|nr:hypothetical protein F4677DRAFT_419081 [Hypoxylon crocopeplum]
MVASDMQVKSLDLAARTIDLTTALLKASSSTGSLLKGAWEIGQWLGREKLNQYELLDCMEKAKGLVVANKNGQGFFDEIIRGLDTQPVGPLFLQQSGSLGRLMAGDPNLSWIVSTIACLFQHHRDDNLVTQTLTAYIMEAHHSLGEEATPHRDRFIYSPEQTKVTAVIRKIVSSVWYNVVNAGCDTIPLPQELYSVCPTGHYLAPEDFGIVANTIQASCPSKAILKTDHLLRDIILWLLLHYDGTIVVTVSGRILHRAELGNPHRQLEVHVKSACPEEGCGCPAGKESYEILGHISGKFEDFFRGYSFSEFSDVPPRPGIRQKLYDIPRLYPNSSKMWRRNLQIQVEQSAQPIMKWLLDIPLYPQVGFSSPGFTAKPLEEKTAGDQLSISLVLKRVPAMINLEWGSLPSSQVVFWNPPSGDIDTESQMTTILSYFPILEDLMTKISWECVCRECSIHGPEEPNERRHRARSHPKQGCLRRLALEETLLLLAHGVADSFGVNDASSVSEATSIVQGMVTLLVELVHEKRVYWDTWFALASCVYLGCPFQQPVQPGHPTYGGTSFAAIQYGNLATVAPWLDLTQELTVKECFGLTASKGRLGVITKSSNQHVQFRSVEENLAVIETENTEETTSFSYRNMKAASLIDSHFYVETDESTTESDVILCQIDDKFYRLLLRIETDTHWRVVDPSDALNAVIRMLPPTSCRHIGDELPQMPPFSAMVYTMDEVLGRWPDTIRRISTAPSTEMEDISKETGMVHLTRTLNTHLKKNVALALSVSPTAVPNYPELACPSCTLDHARQAKREPLAESESGDLANRYIINLLPNLAGRDKAARRRLMDSSNT